jgi:pimeloyl-ACP methyl ester carboxylesterase
MWSRLARVLREAGQDVHTPSLTGIGERAHLASASVDLATHVADVVNALRYEDLRDVVLVGHSYGGMVVTGAADREPARVRTLVYLDAFVPESGQALVDLAPGIRAAFPAEGWQVPPRPPQAQGMTDEREIAWIAARRSPQPLRTFTDKLPLEGAFRGEKVYVFCSGYSPSTFAPFAAKTRNDPAWRYHELPTHHYPQVSMPAETAGVLLNYA